MKHFLRLVFIGCLVFAGCGDPKISVHGIVTVGGEPMPNGSINFVPADGRGPTIGGAVTAGRYTILKQPSAAAGEKRVEIVALRKTGRRVPTYSLAPAGSMVEETQMIVVPPQSARIAVGDNERSFDIP